MTSTFENTPGCAIETIRMFRERTNNITTQLKYNTISSCVDDRCLSFFVSCTLSKRAPENVDFSVNRNRLRIFEVKYYYMLLSFLGGREGIKRLRKHSKSSLQCHSLSADRKISNLRHQKTSSK